MLWKRMIPVKLEANRAKGYNHHRAFDWLKNSAVPTSLHQVMPTVRSLQVFLTCTACEWISCPIIEHIISINFASMFLPARAPVRACSFIYIPKIQSWMNRHAFPKISIFFCEKGSVFYEKYMQRFPNGGRYEYVPSDSRFPSINNFCALEIFLSDTNSQWRYKTFFWRLFRSHSCECPPKYGISSGYFQRTKTAFVMQFQIVKSATLKCNPSRKGRVLPYLHHEEKVLDDLNW